MDANALTTFYPPSSVMETAVAPVNSSVSLDFYWTPENPTSKFYVYMHFAEVEELQPNQTREFNITQNGEYFIGPISPSYLYSTTAYSVYPVSGDKIQYSIFRTPKSTLPPILNGLEVYMALETTESQTDEQDGIDFILFFSSILYAQIFSNSIWYISAYFLYFVQLMLWWVSSPSMDWREIGKEMHAHQKITCGKVLIAIIVVVILLELYPCKFLSFKINLQ